VKKYFALIRSLWLWKVFFSFLFILALLAPLFKYISKRPERAFQGFIRGCSNCALKMAGIKVVVEGVQNLSPGQGYIIAVNHSSFMDNLVLLARLPVLFKFLADEAGFSLPFLRRIYRAAGYLKTGIRMDFKDTYALYKALRQGENVLVYSLVPERGEIGKFSSALPAFAREAQVPVLPVCLKGCSQVLPINKFVLRDGKIRMNIGKPIYAPDLNLLSAEIQKIYES
jgi:1-acyl-sn-glycerol-3-phosphate acyltransferase